MPKLYCKKCSAPGGTVLQKRNKNDSKNFLYSMTPIPPLRNEEAKKRRKERGKKEKCFSCSINRTRRKELRWEGANETWRREGGRQNKKKGSF